MANSNHPTTIPEKTPVPAGHPLPQKRGSFYKWELVILLWFAYFLNQGDRQIYNVVIPLIKEDLHLSDVQLGLVATIFTFCYGILVPFAGLAGDLFRRKWIIFFSLLFFSLGTLLTGFANGLFLLILFRSLTTGGGEAFYYPAATSLLGQFHKKTRATAMAIHQTSVYAGIIASGFIAGYIGERYGWRMSFYSFGFLGIALAIILFFRMKDTPQPTRDMQQPRVPLKEIVSALTGKKTVILLCLAFGGMVFVNVGYLTWMPTYLHEKYGLSLSDAGFSSMAYHHVFAFIGVLAGAGLSDRLAARRKKIRMHMEFWGLLLGAPFIYLMGITDNYYICLAALAGFGFFRGLYDSNLFAALFDVVAPEHRSSGTGLMLAFAFTIGALAPVVLGWVKTAFGLSAGIASLSVFYLLGSICVFIALTLYFNKEYIKPHTDANN